MILSARWMVESRCAMISAVRPSTMRLSASRTRNSVSVSTLEVASSRIRIFGLCASARERNQLFLSGRECRAAFAHFLLESSRQAPDEVAEVDILHRLFHVLVLNARRSQPDVARNRAAE